MDWRAGHEGQSDPQHHGGDEAQTGEGLGVTLALSPHLPAHELPQDIHKEEPEADHELLQAAQGPLDALLHGLGAVGGGQQGEGPAGEAGEDAAWEVGRGEGRGHLGQASTPLRPA